MRIFYLTYLKIRSLVLILVPGTRNEELANCLFIAMLKAWYGDIFPKIHYMELRYSVAAIALRLTMFKHSHPGVTRLQMLSSVEYYDARSVESNEINPDEKMLQKVYEDYLMDFVATCSSATVFAGENAGHMIDCALNFGGFGSNCHDRYVTARIYASRPWKRVFDKKRAELKASGQKCLGVFANTRPWSVNFVPEEEKWACDDNKIVSFILWVENEHFMNFAFENSTTLRRKPVNQEAEDYLENDSKISLSRF